MASDGICGIKPEFIISGCSDVENSTTDVVNQSNNSEYCPPDKRQKLSKTEKKKRKGQNKNRPVTFRQNKETQLCHSLINVLENEEFPQCKKANCNFMHNVQEYLKSKPSDIGDTCYNFVTFGHCLRGLTCRFGNCHITADGRNRINSEKQKSFQEIGLQTLNNLTSELQHSLRKRQYDFKLAEKVVKYCDHKTKEVQEKEIQSEKTKELAGEEVTTERTDDSSENQLINNSERNDVKNESSTLFIKKTQGVVTDEDIIKLINREKKKIVWRNKLYLSPLTTVGNLPFRRICKEFGADITCGEMAMCSSLLQGSSNEWALVKRHHTEDLFGVQLCANNPHILTKCVQLLEQETKVDFIDLNLGCPIDLVYREGAGCGLLRRPRVLEACVKSASHILSIPFTVKTRTGVYTNQNIAHTLVKKFEDWGASAVTVHGRSREQRYTKLADWNYIRTCTQIAHPLPVIGNGDILSYEDYKLALETCPEVATVMIGRAALIKPWIFTEIKEQKLFDISSSERFEIIKKYVNYGLEHWGSDNKGVENTRRFLLEWLSFLYRYVPVGLLERPPQKINQRPPKYRGRDHLETLMASSSCADWIKISEMLLGPVPVGFQFLPKHKANSY